MKTDGLLQGLTYHNPNPLACLTGFSNEAKVVIEGVETIAVTDTGAEVSTITEGFYWTCGLEVKSLWGLLHLRVLEGLQFPIRDISR